jgi:hypothetical protein
MLETALKREMVVQPTAAHIRDPRPQLPRPFIAEVNRHRPKSMPLLGGNP